MPPALVEVLAIVALIKSQRRRDAGAHGYNVFTLLLLQKWHFSGFIFLRNFIL